MYEQGSGVEIDSASAVTPRPPAVMLHQPSARAALKIYTVGPAGEAGPRGIRVNLFIHAERVGMSPQPGIERLMG